MLTVSQIIGRLSLVATLLVIGGCAIFEQVVKEPVQRQFVYKGIPRELIEYRQFSMDLVKDLVADQSSTIRNQYERVAWKGNEVLTMMRKQLEEAKISVYESPNIDQDELKKRMEELGEEVKSLRVITEKKNTSSISPTAVATVARYLFDWFKEHRTEQFDEGIKEIKQACWPIWSEAVKQEISTCYTKPVPKNSP